MLILRVGKAYKILLDEMIKTLLQGMLFKESDNKSIPILIQSSLYLANQDVFYFEDTQTYISAKLIRDFSGDIIHQVPLVSRCLLPIVSAINEKISNKSTQDFLFKFMSLALSGESTMIGDEGVYLFAYFYVYNYHIVVVKHSYPVIELLSFRSSTHSFINLMLSKPCRIQDNYCTL